MQNNVTKKHIKKNNKTKKNTSRIISGKILQKTDGWIVAEIRGSPYERGFAHGYLLYKELRLLKRLLPFILQKELKVTYNEYVKQCNLLIKYKLQKNYPDCYDEILGIVAGAKTKGVNISLDFIVSWNACTSLDSYFNDGKKIERCSAFIATGDATEKGDIIVAHNTHYDFMSARLYNLMLYVFPDRGNSFVMQTAPGLIYSAIDWFICANGIIGTETTISQINYKPKFGNPIFCRMRKAMQYANTLDEYVNILLEDNAGDYACSWLFGDTRTNEIMLFEIGLKKHSIKRTKNGVFYGMNSPNNKELRETETDSKDYYNIRTSIGNRRKRLNYLLNKKHYGKINISNAKDIISDHYDYHLNKDEMNKNSICKHTEVDDSGDNPYKLSGALDGKVVNSAMINSMTFLARYGSSCGKRKFVKEQYLKNHPDKEEYRDFIVDIPIYPWTIIQNIN